MRRLAFMLALVLFPATVLAAPLLHTFDADLEGWTVSGDNTHSWMPNDGNPGGYLDVDDLATGLMNHALAPPAWLGDWSALGADDTLSLDVYQRRIDGTTTPPAHMFVLEGPGGRAVAIPAPNPPNDVWSHWSVSLSPADWTVTTGSWAALMLDVQVVQVAAEFVNGNEETRLDNMYLSTAPDPVARECVVSLLDSGSEDWTVQNTGTITMQSGSGDGGGFMQIADGSGLTTLYAGSRFRGDLRPFEDIGTFGLSLRVLSLSGTSLGPVPLIRMSGPGGSAEVQIASADLPPAPRLWKRFEYPLTEAVWTVTGGSWDALLEDVTELRLQLEFWGSGETIGFDRFTLLRPACDDGAPRPVLHVGDVSVCGHVSMSGIRSVAHDPFTGEVAGVVDASSTTGGLWWLTGAQAGVRLQAYSEATHALFASNGDAFTSDDLNGIVYRRTAAGVSETWATGFHSGDDDPIGMCFAPSGFSGPAVQPGDVLVADWGFNGPDEIWAFSAAVAETDVQLFASPAPRVMFDLAAGDGVVFVADSSMADRRLELFGDGTVQEVVISPPIPAMTSVVHDAVTDHLYVASDRDQSVHRIALADGTTERVADGFVNLEFAALDLDPATRTLWVPDIGAGVTYRLCLPGNVSVARPGPAASAGLALAAHPNPASGAQHVSFTLTAPARVQVDVFDVQGRQVRALARGVRAAGTHRLEWDGRDSGGTSVAPGLYRVRVRAGDAAGVRALVRVR